MNLRGATVHRGHDAARIHRCDPRVLGRERRTGRHIDRRLGRVGQFPVHRERLGMSHRQRETGGQRCDGDDGGLLRRRGSTGLTGGEARRDGEHRQDTKQRTIQPHDNTPRKLGLHTHAHGRAIPSTPLIKPTAHPPATSRDCWAEQTGPRPRLAPPRAARRQYAGRHGRNQSRTLPETA